MNRRILSSGRPVVPGGRAAGVLAALTILALVPYHTAARPRQSHAKAPAPASAPVKAYGSRSAPITIEVFSDYECPACRNFYELTLRPLINDYVTAGKVYLVHRDYPLPMHQYSGQAARWVNAAAEIGNFGVVEAALYDNQAAWSTDGKMEKYVAGAMTAANFRRVQELLEGCDSPAPSAKPAGASSTPENHSCPVDKYIEQDILVGRQIPITQTPTFIIYNKGQKVSTLASQVSWDILKRFLDSLLSQ